MIAKKHNVISGSSIEAVLEGSNANWIAEPQEMITAGGITVPTHKAIVRSDNQKVIGVVGKKYEPVQNSTAFAFMDTLVDEHKAKYEYLYEIEGGKKLIVQAKVDNDFEVRKGDSISTYITMINSFDGSTPFRAYFTPIRMWCSNQLRASLKNATESVSVRHTTNVMAKAEEAFQILCTATEYFEMFKEKSRILAQKSVDAQMVDNFLKGVLGEAESTKKKNQYEEVTKSFESGMGNNGSSVWDLYNGLTEWVDHHRVKNDEKRLANSLVGSGSIMKAKAWDVAMSLV